MYVQLLGPVEATFGGRPVPLGTTKQRALLAMLALNANATVPVDRLLDGLWGDDPPASAPKMVQLYVSQLRRLVAVADAEIVTRGRGYELRVDAEAVDVARFERLVERACRGGDGLAYDAARRALGMWHGAALADVAGEPFAAAEVRRLDALRLTVAELAIDGDLAAGREPEALAQLERLIEAHPLRERLHAQRMIALYRSGRQAEALQAFATARRRLVDDLGIEPGEDLQTLHARILRHDPVLRRRRAPPAVVGGAREAAAPTAVRSRSRRRGLLAVGAAILAATAVFAATRVGGPEALRGITAGAVGVIDADMVAIVEQHAIGRDSGAVAAGAGSVWVASAGRGTVSRIDRDGDRVETIDVGPAPVALAFGAGSVWVAGGEDGAVAQLDPVENRVVQRIAVGNGLRAVAVGHGAVWAAAALDGEVARIDLRSGRITSRIAVGGLPAALATSADAVWVAAEEAGTLVRIDARTGAIVEAVAVGNGPGALAVGLGAVWVANRQDGTVSRIDPRTDRVTDTVPAGGTPVALAVADGALWVADARGAVRRLDPRTRSVSDTVRTGSSPTGLAAAGGAVWASAAAPPAAHRGGTLRFGSARFTLGGPVFRVAAAPVTTLVYDALLAYRRSGGPAGGQLLGGLAAAVPEPSNGERGYVFRLRSGVRYSDGTAVRARDFRASMKRILTETPDELGGSFDAIAGVARCRAEPRRCDLAQGIVTDDRAGTITLRLRRRDPALLGRLTLAPVMPAGAHGAGIAPGSGPYRIARFVPGRGAVLARNPWFRPRGPDGPVAGLADRIEVTMGKEAPQIAAAERGRLDVVAPYATLTSASLSALRTRIGSRLQSASFAMTVFAWLNVEARPFDDVRVRRALNLAVDRGRAVDATGGPSAGTTTCQLLPPGMPGHRPICPFTVAPTPAGAWSGPDRAKARRLVAASGARGTRVEVWAWDDMRSLGRQLTAALRDLGFRSRLRLFDDLKLIYRAAVHPRRRAQIGLTGWIADSPDPTNFLRPVVSCEGYAPGDAGSANLSRFCDRRIEAAIRRAQTAGPTAGAAWRRVERRIAARAPIVPLLNPRSVVVTSPRAGNVQIHAVSGVLLLEQVWVR